MAEVKTTLGDKSLRLLARGKVLISIHALNSTDLRLEGLIIARATCNVYHSVLTTEPTVSNAVIPVPPLTYGSGWALLFVLNDGDFEYKVKLESLPQPVERVSLQLKTRKRVKDLEDVTEFYKDGWVNGTYGNPTYRDLDTLFRGRLQVAVLLEGGGAVTGILEAVSVTEALRSLHPSFLKSKTSWMAASTWVAVDDNCVMHYDVYLSGELPPILGNVDPSWSLQLRENDISLWDPRFYLVNVTLEEEITGKQIAAHTTILSKVSLSRLEAGAAFLDLTIFNLTSSDSDPNIPIIRLSGNLHDVSVPKVCQMYSSSDLKKSSLSNNKRYHCKGFVCLSDAMEERIVSQKCIDDSKFRAQLIFFSIFGELISKGGQVQR